MNIQLHKKPIIDQCKVVFATACDLYNIDFDFNKIKIEFLCTGRSAGRAGYKTNPFTQQKEYYMVFSLESAEYNITEMLEVVIPHELAHIVNYMKPSTGRNHDLGWKDTCRRLGGTGDRCHKQPLTKSVYRKAYLYVTANGHERLITSTKKHNNIQRGTTYTIKSTGESYGRDHFVRSISGAEHKEIDLRAKGIA